MRIEGWEKCWMDNLLSLPGNGAEILQWPANDFKKVSDESYSGRVNRPNYSTAALSVPFFPAMRLP